mmetsp:Transcript_46492/g.119496  ORF Transcript_46492/g.119496 Transcript_46492/m.119496 type:complete len:134 (-) Transcript_46492:209-610(-)
MSIADAPAPVPPGFGPTQAVPWSRFAESTSREAVSSGNQAAIGSTGGSVPSWEPMVVGFEVARGVATGDGSKAHLEKEIQQLRRRLQKEQAKTADVTKEVKRLKVGKTSHGDVTIPPSTWQPSVAMMRSCRCS